MRGSYSRNFGHIRNLQIPKVCDHTTSPAINLNQRRDTSSVVRAVYVWRAFTQAVIREHKSVNCKRDSIILAKLSYIS